MTIQRSVHQKDIIILTTEASNNSSKLREAKTELKGERDKSIIVREFNSSLFLSQ